MANIEHAAITDPQIHEPKGIAAATADQIYVSDGAGSGDWTDVADVLDASASYTLNDLINVRYESNTATSITGETWTQIPLNTVKTNNLSGVSLSSNRVTALPAGTYWVDASVPFKVTNPNSVGYNNYKAKLYNVTGSADLVIGTAETGTGDDDVSGLTTIFPTVRSLVKGVFTLASTSNVELRGWVTSNTNTTGGENTTVDDSAVHVQAELTIWRIA